jgi:hypothetical protein
VLKTVPRQAGPQFPLSSFVLVRHLMNGHANIIR